MARRKVLVAALNWGLGHASRCIPIIDQLRDQGFEVQLASDGDAGIFLQKEYPMTPYFELPSYQITYPEKNFYWHWLKNMPRMLRAIQLEQDRLKVLVEAQSFDLIISDNRYGLYHPKVHSIMVTHQLNLQLPAAITAWLNPILHQLISHFDECWVPDCAGPDNLSGDLSRAKLSIPITYVGVISRMKKAVLPTQYQLAVILSGPEPYRSRLQEQIEQKLQKIPLRVKTILGAPMTNPDGDREGTHSLLLSKDLNLLLNESDVVLSRPGYSSLMDYFTLNKRAILIPTPFQPEQAYLANRHGNRSEFYIPNKDLSDLEAGIEKLGKVSAALPPYPAFRLPPL